VTILNIILDLFNSDELGTSQHKLVYEEATIQWGILFAPYSVVVIVGYLQLYFLLMITLSMTRYEKITGSH